MITIVLAKPNDRCPRWQVFGVRMDTEDRYTFGVREFEATGREAAEGYAKEMMERYGADHFERR